MASVGTIKYKSGSNWIDILHPVNSFHISTNSTSPATLFGGTWTQITNAALRAATSTGYTGSDTHTLTINEMPNHGHNVRVATWQSEFGGQGIATAKESHNYTSDSLGSAGAPIVPIGGGQRIQLCNAPTTVTFGTERRNISKGGDSICECCHRLESRMETVGRKSAHSRSDISISLQSQQARQVPTVVRGQVSRMAGFCGHWVVTKNPAVGQRQLRTDIGRHSAKKMASKDSVLPAQPGGQMEQLTVCEQRKSHIPSYRKSYIRPKATPQKRPHTMQPSRQCHLGGNATVGLEQHNGKVGEC